MTVTINGTTGIDKVASGAVETTDLPAGTVLQVVQFTTIPSNIYTTSTSYVDSGMLDVFITPKAAGSKIIVTFENFIPHCNPGNSNFGGSAKIYRSVAGGSAEAVTASGHDAGWYIDAGPGTDAKWFDMFGFMQALDTPTYTVGQQLKYTAWCRCASNNVNNFYFHHTGGLNARTDSGIVKGTAMEIAA